MAAGVPSDVSTFDVPSIMKLFDVGRDPMMLIALPTPWRIAACSPSVSTAPGAEEQQLEEVAAVQRQLRDLPLADDLSDRRRLGIECRGIRPHLDPLADVARLELQIDALHLVDVQLNVGLDRELEA